MTEIMPTTDSPESAESVAKDRRQEAGSEAASDIPTRPPLFSDPFDYEVDADLFRRVRTFVSHEATRYYLHGVAIEPLKGGGAILVATDGRRLVAAHDQSARCARTDPVIVKVDGDFAKSIEARARSGKRLAVVCGHSQSENSAILLSRFEETKDGVKSPCVEYFKAAFDVIVDGTYPDWRRALPTDERTIAAGSGFAANAKFIADFAALNQGLGATHFFVNGADEPIFVTGDDPRMFGILMPMRAEKKAWALPEWARNKATD